MMEVKPGERQPVAIEEQESKFKKPQKLDFTPTLDPLTQDSQKVVCVFAHGLSKSHVKRIAKTLGIEEKVLWTKPPWRPFDIDGRGTIFEQPKSIIKKLQEKYAL